jgi:small subunit ribosomal protein S16
MLIIRLSRIGKKNYPTFRIIVSEKTKDTKGDYLELLGSYNPHTKEAKIKADRVKYWLSKGVKMSATINNLFINKKVIEGKKVKVFKPKKKAIEETANKTVTAEKKEEVKKDEKQITTEKKETVKKEEPVK